jgi:hypothetical protein
MQNITAKNFNAIEENFEKRTFKEILNQQIVLPFYQLKKHYPEIYGKPFGQIEICQHFFLDKILKRNR